MTPNPRILLWIGLALVLWINYQAWVHDYGPMSLSSTAVASSQATSGAGNLESVVPRAASDTAPPAGAPGAATASQEPVNTPATAPAADFTSSSDSGAGVVHVKTNVLSIEIGLKGGTLEQADLLKYPKVKGGEEPVRLLNHDSAQSIYELQSGLTAAADGEAPSHLSVFTASQDNYELGTAAELRVPLTWTDGHGVTVTKTYIFHPDSYRIGLEYAVANHSDASWQGAEYAQILRYDPPQASSRLNVETYAFRGPAIYDGAKYRKLKIDNNDDRRLSIDVKNGWLAALQHHFVSAIIPAPGVTDRFTLGVDGRQFLLGAVGPQRSVGPGDSAIFDEAFFVGPKLQAQLKTSAPNLDRVADYGSLYILAEPLFWLLDHVHSVVGNWGVTIIITTFLLKLLFYPLSEASGRSMAKMKALSPRIKNLQESLKDDREKLGRAMMELYQREKVNPVAGCLPMVIQIPVFLAFYWVLLESVEMRQAPFMGWITDLSSRDPLYILPAIMAGAMFIQYKLNPAPPDPVQAKVFMVMPLVMSVTFAFFPAGLVLYWVTNTILSIAQQWNINRRIAAAATARKH